MNYQQRAIQISYLTGIKQGTTELFEVEAAIELVVGTQRGSRISFSGGGYPEVADYHASLYVKEFIKYAEVTVLPVEDNIVSVNEEVVEAETEHKLSSGDIIQFGEGGPTIKVDIVPPPEAPLPKKKRYKLNSARGIWLFFVDIFKTQINITTVILLVSVAAVLALFYLISPDQEDQVSAFKNQPEDTTPYDRAFELSFDWKKNPEEAGLSASDRAEVDNVAEMLKRRVFSGRSLSEGLFAEDGTLNEVVEQAQKSISGALSQIFPRPPALIRIHSCAIPAAVYCAYRERYVTNPNCFSKRAQFERRCRLSR
jgi:hypothetical protein